MSGCPRISLSEIVSMLYDEGRSLTATSCTGEGHILMEFEGHSGTTEEESDDISDPCCGVMLS
jgi:hypothetical protein